MPMAIPQTQSVRGACTRTNNLKYASDDLYYLHALLKGLPELRVYGAVTRLDNDVTRATSSHPLGQSLP